MKFHYQKNYVDCETVWRNMTKQDYNSVRGLHGQAQETKGSKQRTLLRSKWYSQKKKKKKRRQCGRGWEGHRNTYKQRCLLVSYTHTHSLPQSQQKPKTRTQMTECTPHTADPRVWSETLPGLKFWLLVWLEVSEVPLLAFLTCMAWHLWCLPQQRRWFYTLFL